MIGYFFVKNKLKREEPKEFNPYTPYKSNNYMKAKDKFNYLTNPLQIHNN